MRLEEAPAGDYQQRVMELDAYAEELGGPSTPEFNDGSEKDELKTATSLSL
jgi:hypothetical protein